MRFRNDDQRKAVFANMFKGSKGKGTKVNSNSVINFEVRSAKRFGIPKTPGIGRFERQRMHPKIKSKRVGLKAPLFPPSVLKRRIDASLTFFFEDLEEYGDRIGLNVEPMQKKGDKVWENNIIRIEQTEDYSDGRPKKFRITYNVVSFKSSPEKGRVPIESVETSNKHVVDIAIPKRYPDQLGQCTTFFQTPTWSSVYGQNRERAHICLHVNGEIDRIAMHLLQQLLWEPTHELRTATGVSEFVEGRRDEIHEYLEEKTKELHK